MQSKGALSGNKSIESNDRMKADSGGKSILNAKDDDYIVCTGEGKSALGPPGDYIVCSAPPGSASRSESISRTRKRKRKRTTTKKPDPFYVRYAKFWPPSIAIVAVITIAAIAVGIYLTLTSASASASATSPTSTQPPSTSTTPTTPLPPLVVNYTRSFYDAVCAPYFPYVTGQPADAMDLKKCGVGSPPAIDTCSGGGTCTFYSYGASYEYDEDRGWTNWTFTNKAQIYRPSAQLVSKGDMVRCQTDTGKVGVCDGDKCRETKVEEEQTTHTNSKWEDNCDQPNPCWQGEPMDKFTQNAPTTREQCLQKDSEYCGTFSYVSVVPWMQHLRCKSGKDSTATAACAGIPLKLWVCTKCPGDFTSRDYLDKYCDPFDRNYDRKTGCHFHCINRDDKRVTIYDEIADGGLCLDAPENGTGYCYAGTCFRNFAALDETNKIPTNEECLQKQKGDE